MGQVLYERPREKLRSHGVAYLTTAELTQLIIGSGSARFSAARLAKEVGGLIETNRFSYESLIAITGLGDAKVCQLLAAFEFGKRLTYTSVSSQKFSRATLKAYTQSVRLRRSTLLCIWFDGSRREIDRKQYVFNKRQSQHMLARTIFADALTMSARSLLVYIHKDSPELTADAHELELLGRIYESSKIFHITIVDIIAMHKAATKSWGSEV